MAHFRTTIETTSAAFYTPETNDSKAELEPQVLADLLTEIARQLAEGRTSGPVRDHLGTHVGEWEWDQ